VAEIHTPPNTYPHLLCYGNIDNDENKASFYGKHELETQAQDVGHAIAIRVPISI
jgi:hypothetical protein